MENYKKLRKIGQGAFGKVFLVKSRLNREQYVLKEIEIDPRNPKARKVALDEVHFMEMMNHPNIISVVEYFEAGGILYIIMQYADGGDLERMIKDQRAKRKPFSEELVMSWIIQMCLALKHVHDKKILHRDIKTPNIFLTKDHCVKLGDFGVARTLENTKANAQTTIGTPYYFSPEVCQSRPYNHKSDMWALGVVAYELTTLKRPFEGQNIFELARHVVHNRPAPVPNDFSPGLQTLIYALLEKDHRNRPSVNQVIKSPFVRNYMKKLIEIRKGSLTGKSLTGKSTLHSHPLTHCEPYPGRRFSCDNCSNKQKRGERGWHCSSCPDGYDLCDRCFRQTRADGKRKPERSKYKCGKCGDRFLAKERFVVAEGENYHAKCLLCDRCGVSVQDGYLVRDGKRMCVTCYDELEEEEAAGAWTCSRCDTTNEEQSTSCKLCRVERAWLDDDTSADLDSSVQQAEIKAADPLEPSQQPPVQPDKQAEEDALVDQEAEALVETLLLSMPALNKPDTSQPPVGGDDDDDDDDELLLQDHDDEDHVNFEESGFTGVSGAMSGAVRDFNRKDNPSTNGHSPEAAVSSEQKQLHSQQDFDAESNLTHRERMMRRKQREADARKEQLISYGKATYLQNTQARAVYRDMNNANANDRPSSSQNGINAPPSPFSASSAPATASQAGATARGAQDRPESRDRARSSSRESRNGQSRGISSSSSSSSSSSNRLAPIDDVRPVGGGNYSSSSKLTPEQEREVALWKEEQAREAAQKSYEQQQQRQKASPQKQRKSPSKGKRTEASLDGESEDYESDFDI